MTKAKLSGEIVATYEKEREEKRIKMNIPETRFGQNNSEKIYFMAKKYKNESFEVLGVIPNPHLGHEYDMVILKTPEKEEGVRRMWLKMEEE